MTVFPIGSMYCIFTYINHKNQPNVGKYTSPMDPMGFAQQCPLPKVHLPPPPCGWSPPSLAPPSTNKIRRNHDVFDGLPIEQLLLKKHAFV